jgi:ABC-type branched-subunit amino acid transport system substrate-binding protein
VHFVPRSAARPTDRPGRRRPRLLLLLGLTGLLALAACGTRLPDSSFTAAQQAQAGSGLPTAGPTATTGPGGSLPSTHGTGGPTVVGTSGPTAGPHASGGPTSGPTGPGHQAKANYASDTGVTATTITIGNIVSRTNPFDPRAFVGPAYGIEAFVHWTNAHGGIDGRQIILDSCDDQGSADADQTCVHRLIDSDHVFALVSNAILDYSGADYVDSKGVPDVGSQPIDPAYDRYPHLWDIYGEPYPRDGKQYGFNGKLYGGTEVYQYFSHRYPNVPKVAGVVEYNQSASERFGDSIAAGLAAEGYKVDKKVVNFALPDYDSVAIDFRNQGVKYVYDTIDREGNVRLCKALDDNNVDIVAKVLTPQSWEQSIGQDYSDSPHCRNALWATGNTRNYEDTQYTQVKDFRAQMSADGHGGTDDLSEWALEGWAGGLWFADAAGSCGADLTRNCVGAYLNTGKPYVGHGLLTPRTFDNFQRPHEPVTNCLNVARWSDSAHGWVTQTPDMDHACFRTNETPYNAT